MFINTHHQEDSSNQIMRISPITIAILLEAASLASAENNVNDEARPLRKRLQLNHKSHHHDNRHATTPDESDPYLGISQQRHLIVGSMSMSDTVMASCSFCPDGMPDPDFVIPTPEAATCGTAKAYADTLSADADACNTVQLAQVLYCCPPRFEMGIGPVILEPSTSCEVCPDGLLTVDGSTPLPGQSGATCDSTMALAENVNPTNPVCPSLKQAAAICCPPVPVQPTVEPPTSLTSNIVDLAVATDELSTLVAAVTAAGLGDALSGDGPFTVFGKNIHFINVLDLVIVILIMVSTISSL